MRNLRRGRYIERECAHGHALTDIHKKEKGRESRGVCAAVKRL